jgi:predicted O-linked N-acetylglucosamine transferase (SPINDLY family)
MHFEGNQDKNSRLVSSILMTSLYCEDLDAESIANLHRTYAVKLEEVNLSKYKFIKKTNTKRTLKVGYVTGDLYRQHPVNIFMLPLLQQLKTSSIESVIYYTGSMYDSYTSQARECVGDWVEAASLDDDALHQKIIDDEIDILIDLAGHTSTHRLGVFIKRSAPVQVTFLGYPHSTGLSCMDYIIGDHVVTPKEHDFLFSEKIARLNGPVFCWSPVDNYPLPSYVGKTGPVIFGSFNNLLKLSPRTIELWSSILQSVPESKLLLKAPGFVSPEISNHFKNLFGKHSISDHRLIFREPSELGAMMQEYGEIDIALDPLPYNGGTTTLQALWMGVPLITLPGENFASRMGASFLSVLQRTDWIASDHASYVQIAVRMAQSIDKIRGDRFNIRAEMQRSLLCDIKTYSREFERTLHEIAKK